MNEEIDDKYKLVREGNYFRIVALRPIPLTTGGVVSPGSKGGLVESEDNLSQKGDCWIGKDALVYGKARVEGDAYVADNSIVCCYATVKDNAIVCGECQVSGCAVMRGNAVVKGRIWVCGDAVLGMKVDDISELFSSPFRKLPDFEGSYRDGELLITRYNPETNINPRKLKIRIAEMKLGKKSKTKGAIEVGYATIGFNGTK